MKTTHFSLRCLAAVMVALATLLTKGVQPLAAEQPETRQTNPNSLDQLGVVAGKQYQGDGLSITATPLGARLHCVFQRLEAEATAEGLWLSSTAQGASGERFRVMATAVARGADGDRAKPIARAFSPSQAIEMAEARASGELADTGRVEVTDGLARFIRPGLTEEYSVSMDGTVLRNIIEELCPGQKH